MKTAEEWMKEWIQSKKSTIEFMRAIQADALNHAAEICRAYGRTEDLECAEAIEVKADTLL